MKLTEKVLAQVCNSHGLYSTPSVNTKLPLQHLGLEDLGTSLKEFCSIRTLHLSDNRLVSLHNLTHQTQLQALFVARNQLASLASLQGLPLAFCLHTLDVTGNKLNSLDGVQGLLALRNLNATANRFDKLICLSALSDLPSLQDLQLENCGMKDPNIVTLLKSLTDLRSLSITRNELTGEWKPYRKRAIASFPQLESLDGAAIEELERECACAFVVGGPAAEAKARADYHSRQRARSMRNRRFLRRTLAEGRLRRSIKEGHTLSWQGTKEYAHTPTPVTSQDTTNSKVESEAFNKLVNSDSAKEVHVDVNADESTMLVLSDQLVVNSRKDPATNDGTPVASSVLAECIICQSILEAGCSMMELSCSHSFHAACVRSWLARQPTCPVCREQQTPTSTSPMEGGLSTPTSDEGESTALYGDRPSTEIAISTASDISSGRSGEAEEQAKPPEHTQALPAAENSGVSGKAVTQSPLTPEVKEDNDNVRPRHQEVEESNSLFAAAAAAAAAGPDNGACESLPVKAEAASSTCELTEDKCCPSAAACCEGISDEQGEHNVGLSGQLEPNDEQQIMQTAHVPAVPRVPSSGSNKNCKSGRAIRRAKRKAQRRNGRRK